MRVRNFKSLRDVTLDLGLRNVLVGPNNAGKSNLISVFKFLQFLVFPEPGTYGLLYALNQMGGFSELAWKGSDSSLVTIGLEGTERLASDASEAESVGWQYEISILGNPQGSAVIQDERLVLTRSAAQSTLIERIEGDRVARKVDGTILLRLPDRDRPALQVDFPDWEGNAVRTAIRSWQFFQLVPQVMKQSNQTAAVTSLNPHGNNLSSWLMLLQTRYPESFGKIARVARDVFPGMQELFTWPTQQATVHLAATETGLKRPVSIWQMSDGQLAFIALLSLIYSPEELGASLYCIEEPETYLHPRLIDTLVELLRQEQGRIGSARSAQLIITTHSLHLIDKMDLEEVVAVERRAGATVCTRPSSSQHLKELLASEEVGLGQLYYSGALGSA